MPSYPDAGDVKDRRLDRASSKAGAGMISRQVPSKTHPWTGGREIDSLYFKRASRNGSGAVPKRPSTARAKPLYKGNKDRSGN
jgi:hypothetical protein